MSFIIKRRTAAEFNTFASVEWPSHLLAIMNGLDSPPSAAAAMGLRPIFSDDFVLDCFEQADTNLPPEFTYVRNSATSTRYLSAESFHKCLNFLWQCLNEDDRYMPFDAPAAALVPDVGPMPPSGGRLASAPAPAVKRDDSRLSKTYNCNVCKVDIYGLDNLYAHHIAKHGGKWAWPKLKDLVGPDQAKQMVDFLGGEPAPAPKPEHKEEPSAHWAEPPALARKGAMTFTMTQHVDLRVWPDGRYALRKGAGEDAIFIIKRTVKRPYTRRGRFVWGATTHAWQTIKPGTIELRQQSGDTKKLIGEQLPGEDFYRGELGEVMEGIAADLPKALSLYGKLMHLCAYCGRSLTDELSRMRGIGPDCYEEKHTHILRRKIREVTGGAA